jgi:crotonobetainyl-CoA:carnitine CoA-transferase CaiB-like acyl-CoA transferase
MTVNTLLAPYRVLDLTDDKGFLCGKILADMGADVIKIERPGGDPARKIGPFYHDTPDPEKSLTWFCYNLNKRGITLNIESADGKEMFKRLVKDAHFIIESYTPGYMAEIGLGYEELAKINPGIILTSISPFGQTGPYSQYKGSDITCMGMAVVMYLSGDPDRAPVRISSPQAFMCASADAAAASLVAHYHRQRTGEGQWVDVSAQESIICSTMNAVPLWVVGHRLEKRVGPLRGGMSGDPNRQVWPCKDGYVSFAYWSTFYKAGMISNKAIVDWMESEGMSTDHIRNINWNTWDIGSQTRETWDLIEGPLYKFFLTKTKAELHQGALKRRILLVPVTAQKDLVEDEQLNARGYWVEVEHPELGGKLIYPGAFARVLGADPLKMGRRAPLIGEHNLEIYRDELKLSVEDMLLLEQGGII